MYVHPCAGAINGAKPPENRGRILKKETKRKGAIALRRTLLCVPLLVLWLAYPAIGLQSL